MNLNRPHRKSKNISKEVISNHLSLIKKNPGFPAGIIMPLAGIWAARGQISFFMVMALALAAGLLGCTALVTVKRNSGKKRNG